MTKIARVLQDCSKFMSLICRQYFRYRFHQFQEVPVFALEAAGLLKFGSKNHDPNLFARTLPVLCKPLSQILMHHPIRL